MADSNDMNGSGPQRPPRRRTAAGSGAGASQDTMQFIALAAKSREQAQTQGSAPGPRPGDAGPAQGAAPQDGPYTEPVGRIETERGSAASEPTAFQGAPSGERAEFYDFGLPYGEDAGSRTDDGLVKRRHSRRDRRRRRIRRAVIAVVVLLVVALGASGALLARSALSVRDRAGEAVGIVNSVKGKVTSGEFSTLPDDAARLQALCADIEAETSGPLWAAASVLPVVGSDVSAARELVSVLSEVSADALVPMAEQLAGATPGRLFADGSINVSAVCAVVDALADSAGVLGSANERVQAIGDTHVAQVTELVETAKDGFAVLDGAVKASESLSPVLPAMLGAQGTRSYLVMAQNNVEIRANGGLGGSQGVITITDGQMEIGDFRGSLRVSDDQQVLLTDEENNLFNKMTGNVGKVTGDATMIPDFPRAASIIGQLWEAGMGQHVDGVIALDPVFLQYLLGLVGGVTLPDGTAVDGTNAATVLMHDVYWNYPQEESDAIFASVAQAAFDRILSGIGEADMAGLVQVFARGCDEGRFIVWMEDADEEQAIEDMGIANELPDAGDVDGVPEAGVYLNNVGYSKMDWYLDLNVDVSSGMKRGDGITTYDVTVDIANTCTEAEAANLPGYVGVNKWMDDGSIQLVPLERYIVYLFAPAGGTISDVNVQVNGQADMTMKEGTYNGLNVTYGMLDLYDEESCTVTYTITVPSDAAGELQMRVTPTCQDAREGNL
ncbi:MAG TPA: DUF4012 domain-containing protein [Collinsella ihuae]|uniref:DUF4012 domain-containing protein n=1 Tax=Collinsella ihumii TaxID=1720204 RepID=A0A921IPC8_9ACTN|nr:DUF4012 domain-containing protein [Collinsella ihumii]